MPNSFDVIVVGGGPAGYVAAIRCAQLGMSTACVDNWINTQGKPALGGTCLNVGCIPSKALLESSEKYDNLMHHGKEHGIATEKLSIDSKEMLARKDKIVSELTGGIEQLFQANKITWLQGTGLLIKNKQVQVTSQDGTQQIIGARNIILATGSSPIELPSAPFQDDRVVDSAGALDWEHVPKRLGIIGAGVIGLELGSVWRRLGSKVVLLEAMEDFLPAADHQLARTLYKELTGQGLDIRLGARLTACNVTRKQITLAYSTKTDEQKIIVDKVIVAVGRRPNSHNLVMDDVELSVNERGQVEVNNNCETNIPGIYAIGDLVRGPMLAHKGSEEGVAVAERIAGQQPHVNYDAIPGVIYTHPEVAWVGMTEEEVKSAGVSYRIGNFPFAANGRAKAAGSQEGFVKVLANAETDRVLGVHIMGQSASELIGQAVMAIECECSAEDIARTIFAHPTLSESLHEAALATDGRAIHAVGRRRR